MAERKAANDNDEAERIERLITAIQWLARSIERRNELDEAREAGRRAFSKAVRTRIFEAHGGQCIYCGSPLGASFCLDHVKPLSRGGADDEDNLALSCHPCNAAKGARTVREWKRKRMIRTGARWCLVGRQGVSHG